MKEYFSKYPKSDYFFSIFENKLKYNMSVFKGLDELVNIQMKNTYFSKSPREKLASVFEFADLSES